MSRLRLVIVDDAVDYRRGLRLLLSTRPDLEVVGEACDGAELVAAAPRWRADIVLMDLRMPGMDGVEATRRLRAAKVAAKVLVLTTFDEDELVLEALRAGAQGYLLKSAAPEQLFAALHALAAGHAWLQPAIAATVVRAVAAPLLSERDRGRLEQLSARELEVLRALVGGASNRAIARALSISEGTVKNHLTRIFDKLGVADRTQAALVGRDLGLSAVRQPGPPRRR